MKVYLVENCGNCPGRIMGVFAEEAAANQLAETLASDAAPVAFYDSYDVNERELIYGQAPVLGYNP